MCGFCYVWVCVCVGFVNCRCVYVWVCVCVGFVICGCLYVWFCNVSLCVCVVL